MRTVYLGTSDFAAAILERLADSPHRPALVVTRPDRPKGRGRKLQSPPVARAPRERSGSTSRSPTTSTRRRRARPDRRASPGRGDRLRVRRADEGAVPVRARHAQRPPVAAAALARRGADRAGDHGRRRGDRRRDHARHRRARQRARSAWSSASRSAPTTRSARSSARLASLGADLLLRALDERPPFAEQSDDGVTYAEKITAADRLLDPADRPAAELERTVRALTPHVGARLALPDGSFLGVWGAQLAAGPALAPGTLDDEDGRLLLGCAGGSASSSRSSSRPAEDRCAPPTTCAGRPCRPPAPSAGRLLREPPDGTGCTSGRRPARSDGARNRVP